MTNENLLMSNIQRPPAPESVIQAKIEAYERAGAPNPLCEVKQTGCASSGKVARQIKQIYGFDSYIYEGSTQTPDNYLICCIPCHIWISQHIDESISLGYLHPSVKDVSIYETNKIAMENFVNKYISSMGIENE